MKDFFFDEFTELKQHIGLSQYAYYILKDDYLVFNPDRKPDSWNAFLNKIIGNFQDLHLYPADISHQYDSVYGRFHTLTKEGKSLTQVQKNFVEYNFTKAFIETYKKNQKLSYGKKLSKTFNLSESTASRLCDLQGSIEEKIFETPGKYISAILEAYSRKPFLEREQIVFNEQIQKIEKAIRQDKCIKFIHTTNGISYKLSPYTVQPDKMGTYWYLAGITHKANEEPYYSSFRISRISKIREVPNEKSRLEEKQKQELDAMIMEKGVQFLVGDITKAVIRFTPEGLKNYKNQLHRRPPIVAELSPDTFEFIATEKQLEYYFFGFGKDAEILEPLKLRKIFEQKYKQALKKYTKSSRREI